MTHYSVDEANSKAARDLMDTLRKLRVAWQEFTAVRGCLVEQKDSADDYTTIAATYGYAGADATAQEANAQASFLEIDSAYGNANAAITQMLNRHLYK